MNKHKFKNNKYKYKKIKQKTIQFIGLISQKKSSHFPHLAYLNELKGIIAVWTLDKHQYDLITSLQNKISDQIKYKIDFFV